MTFLIPASGRLSNYLSRTAGAPAITQLTPDASTREFFRIPWKESSAIACVYPEAIDSELPQIDVTNLFLSCGLPVAEIFATDFESGIVIHEDFGDKILRDELADPLNREKYIDAAIELIARIQAGTANAYKTGSIASRLKFDEEKLVWELNFFKTHYFESLRKKELGDSDSRYLTTEFIELAKEIETFSTELTHRDFHSANLMLLDSELRIIDHQDARIGPASYDLVSLLLDRIETPPPRNEVELKIKLLQEYRVKYGLDPVSDLNYQFDLVAVQRCLKAIGTFSNQAANFGKDHYVKYINPMFRVISESCKRLGRFETIRVLTESEVS